MEIDGKKLWKHINRLTGREKKETEVELYKEGKKWKRKKDKTTSKNAGKAYTKGKNV